MTRRRLIAMLAILAASALFAFAAAIAITYWVDPQGERWESSVLTRALDGTQPCAMTTELVGDSPAIAGFKLDVLHRRTPSLVVLGISRSLEIRSRPGEKGFANLGTPGLGPAAALTVADDVHNVSRGPVTVYLDVEPAWLDPRWTPFVDFSLSTEQRIRRYVSSKGLLSSIRFLFEHPGGDPHPVAVTELGGRCVLHTPGQSAQPPYWDTDGSIEWDMNGKGRLRALDVGGIGVAGLSPPDPARLAQLSRLVAQMHAFGWRVVGFTPPLAPWKVKVLHSRARDMRWYATYDRTVRSLLARYGDAYVDLLPSPDKLHCTDADYVFGDGLHPGPACSARLRVVLDRTAAAEPNPSLTQ
jgi:hypothetical protein